MSARAVRGPVAPMRTGVRRVGSLFPAGLVVAAAASVVLLLVAAPSLEAQNGDLERGRQVYDLWCASCHGFEGDGLGPAADYMLPRPRDFTRGLYQIRTTTGGDIPTDADIRRMIDEGMPGTTMPGWRDHLSRRDRDALVAYVKSFYPPFETMGAPEALDFGRAPRLTDERLEEGRDFYQRIECWQCHGDAGRGDGPSGPELEDDWGYPIRAADLTKNWRFNGGGSVEEIYRRLRTGMDGTPMPAFQDLVDGGFMTDDQLWSLAHYVRSLAPERAPRVREVIRAERVEPGEVPARVADERWDEVESFHVPLVAQIIVLPRWFDPAVDGVEVQAVHDGEEIAFRLTWNDRSRSPDPRWMEWQERVLEVMEPKEGDPVEPAPRPDRLAVQFPPRIPDGMQRPFFLMGDQREPVYLWEWRSDEDRARPVRARGMHDIQALDGSIETDAHWEEGRWQLVLRRALEPSDPEGRLRFETGVSIPVAFFAWDGDNGEEGTRGSVSSWFFVHLEEEAPLATYVAPVIAFFLTGGLGLVVVSRAQRRERELGEVTGDEDEIVPGPGGPSPAAGAGPAGRAEAEHGEP
jgi:DMSO reductase family type II enzyme heme b subunit